MPSLDLTQTSWNLTPLLASDTDPRLAKLKEAVAAANQAFVATWKDRTDYLEEVPVLRQALDQYETLFRSFGISGTFGYYFDLRSSQDLNDPMVKAQANKAQEFSTKLANELQFFELTLAKVSAERQAAFLADQSLLPYRHFLERLFANAAHQLSDSEERLLNLKYPTSRANWIQLTQSLLSAEEAEITAADGSRSNRSFEEIRTLTSDRSKPVRDEAAAIINNILERHGKVAEVEINSLLADKKVNDELRHLPRPESSRHLADDISTESVDALIEAVSSRFDIPRRYYALKARLLGLEKLAYHERSLEYGSVEKSYSYAEAAELVHQTFAKIDPQFATIFERFSAQGQIDVYPKANKRGGAFCAGESISSPTYILLNHTEKLNDVLTLAHELGHGINNELMRATQNALTFDTPLSTAEVASTFMEDFVLDELLAEADDELRLSLQVMKLDSDIATIFRQVACYRFEQELHASFRQAGYLSKEEIGAIFLKNMEAYMGPAVSQDAGSQNWWIFWGHIRNFFYVYSYSSGLLISKSLQAMVKQDGATISKVKQFLSTGTSESPQDVFRRMDIDIADASFWKKGIAQVEHLLNETEELAIRIGKITP